MSHALLLAGLLVGAHMAVGQGESDSLLGTRGVQGTFSPLECYRVLSRPEPGSAFVRIVRLEADWTSVDRQTVLDYLNERLRGILDCYERELRKAPSLAGEVELEVAVHPSGRVTAANTISNTANDLVARCTANRVRQWMFPSQKSGCTLLLRFEFFVKSDVTEE